jgi:Bacterial Ig domain
VPSAFRTVALLIALVPVSVALLGGQGLPHGSATAGIQTLDTTKPIIEITSPEMDTILEVPTLTVTGTASDDVAISKIEASFDGETWFLANGTSSWSTWSITLVLPRGGIWVSAIAFDTSGNWDRTGVWVVVVQRTVFESVVIPMFLWAIPVVAIAGLLADVVIWRRRMRTSRGSG